jgi:hypothetical protein
VSCQISHKQSIAIGPVESFMRFNPHTQVENQKSLERGRAIGILDFGSLKVLSTRTRRLEVYCNGIHEIMKCEVSKVGKGAVLPRVFRHTGLQEIGSPEYLESGFKWRKTPKGS